MECERCAYAHSIHSSARWRDNPQGMFADSNPKVSCDSAEETEVFNRVGGPTWPRAPSRRRASAGLSLGGGDPGERTPYGLNAGPYLRVRITHDLEQSPVVLERHARVVAARPDLA